MLARIACASLFFAAFGIAAARFPAAPIQAAGAKKAEGPNGRYDIDPDHSEVIFKIGHMGISNFYGRFNKVGGKVLVDAENPAESMVSLVIDAKSVDTNHEGRDKHLKGPDFFNVEEYGDITFESEKVAAKGGNKFELAGTLKMHGVEKAITVQAEQTGFGSSGPMGTRVGYECRFTIKRADFKMDYQPQALGNDVEVIVSFEGVRK